MEDILSDEEIDILKKYDGPEMSKRDILQIINDIFLNYAGGAQ